MAATNVNDVVPEYLDTGRFEPRASVQTIANAMDVGNPSNFERMLWLYGDDLDAMRRDVVGSRHDDDEVRATIKRVYRGARLSARSAQRDRVPRADGVRQGQDAAGRAGGPGRIGIFLATAHPAKFSEIVEPIIGRTIDRRRAARGRAGDEPRNDPENQRHVRGRRRTLILMAEQSWRLILPRRRAQGSCERHGIRPTTARLPQLVRGLRPRSVQLRDPRAARTRMLASEFPQQEYAGRVDALRNQYPVLSLLPRQFVE